MAREPLCTVSIPYHKNYYYDITKSFCNHGDWTGNGPSDRRVILNTFLSLDLKLTLSMKAKNVPSILKLELVNSSDFTPKKM